MIRLFQTLPWWMLFIFLGKGVYGQQNTESAFYWENPYILNPASVRTEDPAFFSLSARKQWMGMPGSPSTFFATVTGYSARYQSQIGAEVLADRIGYLSTTDLSFSYAYRLRGGHWGGVSFGLAGVYRMRDGDWSEAVFDWPDDPMAGQDWGIRAREWNVHTGMEFFFGRSLIIGLAAHNLLSFFREDDVLRGGVKYLYGRYRTRSLGRRFDANAYRTLSFPKSYDLEAGICIKQYEGEIQVDGMISCYINRRNQKEKLQLSLYGRNIGEIGVLFGVKIPSELKFLFAYDYNFSHFKGHSNGTLEVMITYPLRNRQKCPRPWYE